MGTRTHTPQSAPTGKDCAPLHSLAQTAVRPVEALRVDDLALLLPDWRTHLRARNVAPSTVLSYFKVGANLIDFLRAQGMPTSATGIHREHPEAFLADLADRVAAATVAKHYRSLQQLFRWLTEDGEIPVSPMERMRPPKVPEQPVGIFTDDELARLLKACFGNTFENRRDTALLRFLLDTAMRAGELIGLQMSDIDQELSVAHVMGKGGHQRRQRPSGLCHSPVVGSPQQT